MLTVPRPVQERKCGNPNLGRFRVESDCMNRAQRGVLRNLLRNLRRDRASSCDIKISLGVRKISAGQSSGTGARTR